MMTTALKAMVEAMAAEMDRQQSARAPFPVQPVQHWTSREAFDLEKVARAALDAAERERRGAWRSDELMTVADLVAALQAMPQDARVIVEHCLDNDRGCIEMHANAGPPQVRYLHHHDKELTWDLIPTLEPGPNAEAVVLIAPITSDRVSLQAPVVGADGSLIFHPISEAS